MMNTNMNSDIPVLDANGLRKFGIVTGVVAAVLFGFFIPYVFGYRAPIWPWFLGVLLVFWAIVHPVSLSCIYKSWMKIGLFFGLINTRIILTFLFFLVFLPVGFAFKIFRKDPMKRSFTKQDSYRIKSRDQLKYHMERPY